MSILSRKYPFQLSAHWLRDSAVYCVIVFLILYFLQPFGFSGSEGNKLLLSALFGVLTFLCCAVYGWAVARPLQKRVKPWRIWHQALTVLGMVLFIGICNYILFSVYFHYPLFAWWLCLRFLYWTLIIGVIVSTLSVGTSYYRHLRGQLDTLLEKTTEEQKDVTVTIHDTR
ncbi:MAG: LytTR family transcriptional regulator, partial [Bacteroidales bacterium]|nr:LytTR family transcriptional regulator [Bacteroidales bacterium]